MPNTGNSHNVVYNEQGARQCCHQDEGYIEHIRYFLGCVCMDIKVIYILVMCRLGLEPKPDLSQPKLTVVGLA